MGQSTREFTNCLTCGKLRSNRPMNLYCSRACYLSRPLSKARCAVEGCDRKASGKQVYCQLHYERWRLKGDPGPAGKLPTGVAAWRSPTCSVEGCERPRNRMAFCHMHYARLQRRGAVGEADPLRSPRGPWCSIEGCNEVVEARGWCALHYGRWLKRGEPGGLDPLPKGRPANLDGFIDSHGYRKIKAPNGRWRSEHSVVMEAHLRRPLLKDENVHHVNGQRAQNDLANLELWSSSQPKGQRVIDKLHWAREIVALYGEAEQLHLI